MASPYLLSCWGHGKGHGAKAAGVGPSLGQVTPLLIELGHAEAIGCCKLIILCISLVCGALEPVVDKHAGQAASHGLLHHRCSV